jgi:hypothetical protein
VDLLTSALADAADDRRRLAMLTGLTAGLAGRRQERLPTGWSALEGTLESSPNGRIRTETQALALMVGSPRALADARRTVGDATLPAEGRRRALEALLNVQDEALPPLLLAALDERRLRPAAIRGLAAFNDPNTPTALLDLYPSLPASEKREVLLTLAARSGFARALVDALAAGRIPVRDVSADIARQVRLLDRPEITITLERLSVAHSEIRSLVQSDVSMMPEGLLNPLSDEDVRDLVAYLRGAWQVPLPPATPAASKP